MNNTTLLMDNLINTSRKPWLDALRGFAILLVVYGHQVRFMTDFFVFTSPFKMPLFFAITGYLFKMTDARSFVIQVVKKLVVPWFTLGLIPELIYIPTHGLNHFIVYFLDLVSGKALWFMPCFIIAYIIQYIIRNLCKKTIWIVIASFVCFAIGMYLSHHHIFDYAMGNRAFAVQPFFLIGYLFRLYEEKLTRIHWSWIIVAFLFYVFLCLIGRFCFPGRYIDVHNNKYFNIPLCMLQVYISCFVLFVTFNKSNFNSWIMSFLGQNTLVIYCWHYTAIVFLTLGLSFLGWSLPVNWWTAMIKLFWACILCSIAAIFLNRYLPWIVGKNITKNKNKE